MIKVTGADTAADIDRPEPAMPGLKKVHGGPVGAVLCEASTLSTGFGDLPLQ